MLKFCRVRARGHFEPEMYLGNLRKPTPSELGGVPKIRNIKTHFTQQKPARPLRAVLSTRNLPPVLYEATDQLVTLENALTTQRVEMQVANSLHQLSLGVRNADDFIETHLCADDGRRPTMHDIWFHERGLAQQQHVVSVLPAYQMVPLVSVVAHDFDEGRLDILQVEELYEAMSDTVVAHHESVRRELANTMVRCYALEGNIEKALGVVHDMKGKNVRRSFVTYAPLFRLARKNDDAALHEELQDVIYDLEGGAINKILYIDIPRVAALGWVFVRFNWFTIVTISTCLAGTGTAMVITYTGLM
jgi:pentatricopeptide repeat protein